MKRTSNDFPGRDFTVAPNSQEIFNLSLLEIKTLLPDLGKQELISFLGRTDALQAEALKLLESKRAKAAGKLVPLIPNEIWQLIFCGAALSRPFRLSIPRPKDLVLQKISRVCHLWSNIVREMIPSIINQLKISEWILSKYPTIEVVNLRNQGRVFKSDTPPPIGNAALGRLTNIKELSLESNFQIHSDTVQKLTSLTKLDLTANSVIENDGIVDLVNLKWLKLRGATLIDASAFVNLTNLEYLDIAHTQITNGALKKKTKLTTLYSNNATSNRVSVLTNLTYLSVDSQRITNSGIEKLVNLRTLELLDTSPMLTYEGISKLSNLNTLILRDSGLLFNEEVSRMSNLTSLTTSGEINDEAIQNLTNLVHLDIRKSPLITNDGIKDLTSLTRLELNQFISDEGIRNLTNLKVLDLCENGLIRDYGLEKLTKLEVLRSHDNRRCFKNISQIYLAKLTKD